nr:hypothetical protein [Tanacetum cinerariifolium]
MSYQQQPRKVWAYLKFGQRIKAGITGLLDIHFDVGIMDARLLTQKLEKLEISSSDMSWDPARKQQRNAEWLLFMLAFLKLEKLEISSSDMSWDPAHKQQGNAEWLLFMLAFLLGFRIVNRQCSLVLQAVLDVAASIKPGSSNGGYIRKCFTPLWRDEEGTRPGCGKNVVA